MQTLKENETASVLKSFMKNVGLDHPDADFSVSEATMNLRLSIHFTVDVDRFVTTNKPFMTLFRELQGNILASPLVQDQLKLAADKLAMANAASDELLERIEELEKYKTHYELEMKLRHGESK